MGVTHAVIENLLIKNMTKSARGTKEKPGKNVRQKSGLKPVHHATGLGKVGGCTGVHTGRWGDTGEPRIHEPDMLVVSTCRGREPGWAGCSGACRADSYIMRTATQGAT